jgi:hypothetical protein
MHRYAMCIRDLQFSKLDGIQIKNDRNLQINKILLGKMSENIPFIEHKHSKYAKKVLMQYDPKK